MQFDQLFGEPQTDAEPRFASPGGLSLDEEVEDMWKRRFPDTRPRVLHGESQQRRRERLVDGPDHVDCAATIRELRRIVQEVGQYLNETCRIHLQNAG
jgi:hypothetical protein